MKNESYEDAGWRVIAMKGLVEFLKTTALGGLFVVLPVLLLYMLLGEVLNLVIGLATPIADLFPKGTFDNLTAPFPVAVILLLGVSFVIGLALRVEIGRSLGGWLERKVFGRLPVYGALKSLTKAFGEAGEGAAFRPALLGGSDGVQELIYVVEDHGDGKLTILVPWAPTAFSGFVKIVEKDRVEMLDTNLGEASRILGQWGIGVRELLGKG
jgi:uncharacterized membrane protein